MGVLNAGKRRQKTRLKQQERQSTRRRDREELRNQARYFFDTGEMPDDVDDTQPVHPTYSSFLEE